MANSELHCLPGLYVHMRHSGQSANNLWINVENKDEIYLATLKFRNA